MISKHLLVTLIVTGLGIILLFAGFESRNALLEQNSCEMTYSTRNKEEIPLPHLKSAMKLYKYAPSTKAGELMDFTQQPVLFIPGHRGDVDQVRSFASSMHNKDKKLQYFVVDFGGQDSALHGSSLVLQAAFVNEALRAIIRLYGRSAADITPEEFRVNTIGDVNPFEIVVVGHSLGGIVARLAVTLSNHPSCVVRNLITLSCPHQRPPYSVDASNTALYSTLNQAWKQSFYNKSRECRQAKVLTERSAWATADSFSFDPSSADQVRLEANWDCPYCASKIRLLSITGGDVDLEVATSLTHLDPLSPRPRNISSTRPARVIRGEVESGGIFGFVRSIINGIARIPIAIIRLPYTLIVETGKFLFPSFQEPGVSRSDNESDAGIASSGNATLNVPIDQSENGNNESEKGVSSNLNELQPPAAKSCLGSDNVCSADETVNTTVGLSDEVNSTSIAKSNYSAIEQYFQGISTQAWREDFQDYSEFHHKSVRTVQMTGVKFPVDHQAILWCHQVVDRITKSIHALVAASRLDYLDFNFVVETDHPVPSASTLFSSNLPSNYVRYETTSKFKYLKRCHRRDYNRTQRMMRTVIKPIAAYLERNETLEQWLAARKLESEFVMKALTFPGFSSMLTNAITALRLWTFTFVTSRLPLVALMFVLTSYAISITSLIKSFLGVEGVEKVTYLEKMSPLEHSGIDILWPAIQSWSIIAVSWIVGRAAATKMIYFAGIMVHLVILGATCLAAYQAASAPLEFIETWGTTFSLIGAYSVALQVRLLGFVFVVTIRMLISSMLSIMRTILRWSIYCRPIRRGIRGTVTAAVGFVFKKLNRPAPSYQASVAYFTKRWMTYLSCLIVALLVHLTGYRAFGSTAFSLGIGTYLWCVLTILAFAFLVVLTLQAILFPPKTAHIDVSVQSKEASSVSAESLDEQSVQNSNELVLMYLILIPLGWPSARFSFDLLFDSSPELAMSITVLDIFGPDRISYILALGIVCAHLMKARDTRYAATGRSAKVPWLVACLKPLDLERLDDSTKKDLQALSTLQVNGSCIHEDGGKFAIMESTADLNPPIKKISPFVDLGPTYRVVFCACYRDKALKYQTEWCEWCRCKNCGGKVIPKDVAASFGLDGAGAASSSSDSFFGGEFNPDVGLLVLLIVAAIVTVVYLSSTNSYLYSMSLVAASYFLRDLAQWFLTMASNL